MDTYFLREKDLLKFYGRLAEEFQLFVPVKIESPPRVKCDFHFSLPHDDYILAKYSDVEKQDIAFNEYRCLEPTRAFFTYFKEKICAYFKEEELKENEERPVAVCGIKNCDLFSLKIQDFVFLENNLEDPVYKARRKNTLIISSDCPTFKEVCFCRAFEINPYAAEGFDFNLSPLNDGYLLDVGTEKARDIAGSIKDILTPATAGQLSARQVKREQVIKRLQEHLACHKVPRKDTLQDIVLSGYNSRVWQDQIETCVECGGCVMMCDTCHCFLLADEPKGANTKRMRIWDGCLFKNFARVADGANPLKRRYMRLRNRYLKKFDFFIDNLGIQACCGCGRCIEVCPGRIDIRYILRRLYEEKHLSAH